jgi:membrane dipeptidase
MIKALAKKGGVIGVKLLGSAGRDKEGTRQTINDILNQIDYIAKLVGVDHVGLGLDAALADIEAGRPRASFPWEKIRPDVGGYVRTGQADMKPPYLPMGMERGTASVANLTRGMVARGYSDQEMEKILGLNWLRVFENVWKG